MELQTNAEVQKLILKVNIVVESNHQNQLIKLLPLSHSLRALQHLENSWWTASLACSPHGPRPILVMAQNSSIW